MNKKFQNISQSKISPSKEEEKKKKDKRQICLPLPTPAAHKKKIGIRFLKSISKYKKAIEYIFYCGKIYIV